RCGPIAKLLIRRAERIHSHEVRICSTLIAFTKSAPTSRHSRLRYSSPGFKEVTCDPIQKQYWLSFRISLSRFNPKTGNHSVMTNISSRAVLGECKLKLIS